MAVLTTIDGIPLYTTLEEAIYWASLNGLEGYHTHQYQGQTGYMGGVNQGNVIGEGIMNVYGGLMDFADGATSLLGSKSADKLAAKTGKLSSLLEDNMRDVEVSMEAAVNELKKSGLPGKLKNLATSPEVAGLTEKLGEDLSVFEKQAEEMSKKLGGFFKDNL